MLSGEMLAHLATQGATTYPIEKFRLDRFREVSGTSTVLDGG